MTYYGTKSGEAVTRTRRAISERRPFKAGGKFSVNYEKVPSMEGTTTLRGTGWLSGEWAEKLKRSGANYFVYSLARRSPGTCPSRAGRFLTLSTA